MIEKIQIYFKQQISKVNISGSFSKQDQVLFAKRLSFLMRAGVPILESLKLIHKQMKSKGSRVIFDSVVADVSGGHFLSTALAKHKKLFGEFAINIIRVGETGGSLPENLNYLAEELKKKQELRKKVMSAMFYPIFIVVATLGIVALLTVVVFPKVLPIFTSLNVPLPMSTKILILVSHLCLTYGWFILLGLILLVVGYAFAMSNQKFKKVMNSLMLKIPLAGNISENYYLANFCRTMGLLLKSDSRLAEALVIASKTTENLVYRQEFLNMAGVVYKGERISEYMTKHSNLFPDMIAHMLGVGGDGRKFKRNFFVFGGNV